jgi:nitrogen fixation protein FixH
MEIVAAPDSGAPRGQGGKRVLRVRVTDTAGKPVAGATLSIRLYPDRNSVQEMSAQSHADGTADFQLDAKLLKGLTQIPVTAAAQGVTATRVVDVAQVP